MNTPVGEQLRQARERKNLTLEQVFQQIYIRPRYLKAMETGNFAALPSRAQARGFLRAYAEFLGLEAEPLVESLSGMFSPEGAAATQREAVAADSLSEARASEEAASPEEHAIFTSIGQMLQERRTLLSLPLDEVERRTHIRRQHLEALEAGAFERLPSPVQARGLLKLYAEFLSLDADALLLRFADGLQAALSRKNPVAFRREGKEEKVTRPRWRFVSDWVLVIIVGAVLLGFLGWALGQVASESVERTPAFSPPEIAEVLLATPTVAPSPTPTPIPTEEGALGLENAPSHPEAPTPTPTLDLPGALSGVNINIVVQQRAWLKVITDEKVAFEGRVLPGSAYPFSAKERIEVVTGNAGGVQVYYQGQDLGTLGLLGEAVTRIFTQQGMAYPTPRFTATPTPTEEIPPTPTE